MEAQLQQIKYFIHHKTFWLFAALSSLATLHFYHISKLSAKSPPLIDFLCWGIIFFLLWKKRNRIKFRGSFISSAIGLLLILWMAIRYVAIQNYGASSKIDVLSSLFPFITLFGTVCIIAGFRKLTSYKTEILVSFSTSIGLMVTVSTNLMGKQGNLVTNIDAQFTAFLLHYIGFKVVRQGSIVSLPHGSIEVFTGCSSLIPLATILPIMVLFLSIYSANRFKKMCICISAFLSVIFINAIRLSWLLILVNKGETTNFDYWHLGDGVGIFSNVIVLLIAGLSYQILNYFPATDQDD